MPDKKRFYQQLPEYLYKKRLLNRQQNILPVPVGNWITENIDDMMQKNYEAWVKVYEQVYGEKLVYSTKPKSDVNTNSN